MRQYKSKFLKHKIKRYTEEKNESHDAIIHTIDNSQRWCGVKIQGSDNIIRAYYPENWEKIPYWLKIGNCVRISHCGGNRGRSEILGMGILRPTPVAGSSGDPDIPTSEDAILAGLEVKQIPVGNYMRIYVTVGSVRFDDIIYSVDPLPMGSTDSYMLMGMDIPFGSPCYLSSNFSPPSAGYYRIDAIVIGSDLVIDIVQGTAVTADPQIPTVPSGHLLIDTILLYGGMTKIQQIDIGRNYTPTVWHSSVTVADQDLAWAELSTTITVAIVDQYGNPVYQSGNGWKIGALMTGSTGTLSCGSQSGYSGLPPTDVSFDVWTGSSSNQAIFTYTRDETLATETGVHLYFIVTGITEHLNVYWINLYDVNGKWRV